MKNLIEKTIKKGYYISIERYPYSYSDETEINVLFYENEEDANIAMSLYEYIKNTEYHFGSGETIIDFFIRNINALFFVKNRCNISFDTFLDFEVIEYIIMKKFYLDGSIVDVSIKYFPNDVLYYESEKGENEDKNSEKRDICPF